MYKYWPYDETEFILVEAAKGAFSIKTPWLITNLEVKPASAEFIALLEMSQNREKIDMQNMLVVSKIFSQLSGYPIAYQLPRTTGRFGKDEHKAQPRTHHTHPAELAKTMGLVNPGELLPKEWYWDHDAALELATCSSGTGVAKYDSLSLLSVARRFSYLDGIDDNMSLLYRKIENIPDLRDRQAALAIVVRQNHYVAQKCQQALEKALPLAQSQTFKIKEFMKEEKGHHRILAAGLEALGLDPSQVPTTPAVENLMKTFEQAARTNFLGFCLSLDFFEKPEFTETDSLAKELAKINADKASRALQSHKNINDPGQHEGFSLKLLEAMAPVDKEFALQGLRMAELVSHYITQIPYDLNTMIFND